MNRATIISLKICWILTIVFGLSLMSSGNAKSATYTEAEEHFNNANYLFKRLDYEAAIVEYNKVVTVSPNTKIAQDAQYWIGQTYFRLGRYDAALSAFQKILDEYPESKTIPSTKLMIKKV